MFFNYLTISTLLLTAVSAAPLARRDSCEVGTFNCIDGTTYTVCSAGGIESQVLPVPAGTTCQIGVSTSLFGPADASPATTEPNTSSEAPGETSPEASPEASPAEPSPAQASDTAVESPSAPSATPPPQTADGSSCGGFPCISTWPSWDQMKAKFSPIMGTSCESNGWGANNSPDETAQILSAIESLAGSVDQRFVLSIVMQESAGCVRVITTNNGVRNPGLMQDANGAHTCNDAGSVQNPCPPDEISGMIADGVSGGTDNLTKALATAQGPPNNFPDAEAYAVAARIYNSGSFDISDLNNGLGSTASYVTGVMNRAAGLSL